MSNSEMNYSARAWYAVSVRYQNEFKIAQLLKDRMGLVSRVPSQMVWRRVNGKNQTFIRPLLDTYVFIRANLEEVEWRRLFAVSGINGLVRYAGAPAEVPEEQIETLEKIAASDQPVHAIEYRRFSPNERVEMTGGPLNGAVGHFLRSNGRTGMFVVSLDFFQRSLVTEVEASLVRPY